LSAIVEREKAPLIKAFVGPLIEKIPKKSRCAARFVVPHNAIEIQSPRSSTVVDVAFIVRVNRTSVYARLDTIPAI